MGEITYLVKVRGNEQRGFIKPIIPNHCPRYRFKDEIAKCFDGNEYCYGVHDDNVYKILDEKDGIGMLQCSFR